MKDRCGDLARMAFEVTSELVGKVANVWTIRDDQTDLAARHVYVLKKAAWMNVDWPDLPEKGKPEGTYCGGRQVDYRGLEKKSYKERMAAQKFSLNIFVTSKSKKSDNTIKIDAYSDKYEGPIPEGWTCNVELVKWEERFNEFNGKPYRTLVKKRIPRHRGTSKNVGKYHIDFKDGVLNVIVKLKLLPMDEFSKVPGQEVFDYVKKNAEAFWNGTSGYMQWVYHRDDCERKERCNCRVGWDEKKEFYAAGCCKVPVKVRIEQGDDNKVKIFYLETRHTLQMLEVFQYGRILTDRKKFKDHTMKFTYPEIRSNVYAHEVGHMMGFPDQYLAGHDDKPHTEEGAIDDVTGDAVAGGDFPIDDESIMGRAMNRAREIHFKKWQKWLSTIDNFELLKRS